MRLSDSDNVIAKHNYFKYCFDKISGVPISRILSDTWCPDIHLRTQYLITKRYDILKGWKYMYMYVFENMFWYGNILKRHDNRVCAKVEISDVEIDLDTNRGMLMVSGTLPKNITMNSIIVGDLRVSNHETFYVDCIAKKHDEFEFC